VSTKDKKDGRRVATGVAAAAVATASVLAGASGIVTAVPNVSSLGLGGLKSAEDTVLGNALARVGDSDSVESAAAFNS
jgi:hypothetical protein